MKRIRCIKWAEDRSSFCFIFSDGTASEKYLSQKTGLRNLNRFSNLGQISLLNFHNIREEILCEKNLPVTECQFDFFDSLAVGNSRREMFVK